eukprot:CAMPEP_0170169340 /NCGR_PEP_ID=MMETSP0040_2-20121228/2249_1 /TAXON_ID=641309 /ORGANISM="Lotharella oceanica, Strain CCMP622" /LENGTH=212 /DNA_ID=CAMNT_0010408009 /DNA_START=9 /DNA_END=644 /DNA_ORIENTATION=+
MEEKQPKMPTLPAQPVGVDTKRTRMYVSSTHIGTPVARAIPIPVASPVRKQSPKGNVIVPSESMDQKIVDMEAVRKNTAAANAEYLRGAIRKEPFGCPACRCRFPSIRQLEEHARRVDHDKRVLEMTQQELGSLQCPVCHETFTKKFMLQRHFQYHTGEKALTCATCNKSFTYRTQLEQHMRTHQEQARYEMNHQLGGRQRISPEYDQRYQW